MPLLTPIHVMQDVASLQYEAAQLAEKADAEKCTVLVELDRLHKLVASFQAQISEVSQHSMHLLGIRFKLWQGLTPSHPSACTAHHHSSSAEHYKLGN